jgi:uncharacterized protein
MQARLAAGLVRGRVPLFFAALAVVAAALYGVRDLWVESSYRIFFKPDNPQLLAHDAIEAAYTKADNVAFIVAPRDGRVFTRETLRAVQELTAIGWTAPHSIRVDSITNFQYSRAEGDELIVGDFVPDPDALDDAALARLRAQPLAEPALVGGLISDRAHVTSVNVRMQMPDDSRAQSKANAVIMDFFREAAAEVSARYPHLTIHLMGEIVVNHGFDEVANADAQTMVPAMFTVVIVLLALFLRSLSATAATCLVILVSILFSIGALGWLGLRINQVNVSAPIVILTLAVSDCVHVLVHYLNDLRRGMGRVAAMTHAIEINLAPVFLTSLTTAIGFFSLNTSETPPIREFGTVVGIGVLGAMVFTLALLPALMLWLPARFTPRAGGRTLTLGPLADVVLRHHRAYALGALAVAGVLIAFIPRNELNDDTVQYFDEDLPIRQSFDFVQENLSGVASIAYSLPAAGPGGIHDPEYLRKVEAFAEWWKRQPEVRHVTTFVDVVKRLNRTLHGDDPAYYRIPDDRELIAQYVLLYELSLPQGLDLNDAITFDKSATRLSVNIDESKSRQLLELERRAQAWFAQNAPDMQVYGSSLNIMFAHLGQRNIVGMLWGSVLALGLIAATLVLFLRSWKFGLLSLLPNAFPAAIGFGVWGLTSGQVNLAVAGVFSLTLGIVVDNTIHFFSKYLHARQVLGHAPEDAIRYAFGVVGAALLVTTVALALGFSVLAQSDFALNASMGTMTTMVVVIALVFDLLFLPSLLLWADRDAVPRTKPA